MDDSYRNVNTMRTIPRVDNPWIGRITATITRRTSQAGNVKAWADVRLADFLVIFDCVIIQQEGQPAYVRLPEHRSADGTGFAPHTAAIDEQLMTAITDTAVQAWLDGGAA